MGMFWPKMLYNTILLSCLAALSIQIGFDWRLLVSKYLSNKVLYYIILFYFFSNFRQPFIKQFNRTMKTQILSSKLFVIALTNFLKNFLKWLQGIQQSSAFDPSVFVACWILCSLIFYFKITCHIFIKVTISSSVRFFSLWFGFCSILNIPLILW